MIRAFDVESGSLAFELPVAEEFGVTGLAAGSGRIVVTAADETATRLHCIDGVAGRLAWSRDLPDAVASRPCVTADGVFVAHDPMGLVAYDLADGSLRLDVGPGVRSQTTSASWASGDAVPAHDQTVLLADSEGILVASSTTEIVAIATASGRVLWRSEPGSIERQAIRGDSVYVAGMDGSMRRIDLRTGLTVWAFSAAQDEEVHPLVTEDFVLLITGGGELCALGTDDGSVRWRTPAGQRRQMHDGWAVDGGILLQGIYGGRFGCRGRDVGTGEILWQHDLGCALPAPRIVHASDGRCLVHAGKELRILDVGSGELLATFAVDGSFRTVCPTDGDAYVVLVEPGQVARMDLGGGVETWRVSLGDEDPGTLLQGPALISGDTLVLAVPTGRS